MGKSRRKELGVLRIPRIPRKLKKRLKKIPEEWAKYVKERQGYIERELHLDTIFNKDYSDGRKVMKKMFKH